MLRVVKKNIRAWEIRHFKSECSTKNSETNFMWNFEKTKKTLIKTKIQNRKFKRVKKRTWKMYWKYGFENVHEKKKRFCWYTFNATKGWISKKLWVKQSLLLKKVGLFNALSAKIFFIKVHVSKNLYRFQLYKWLAKVITIPVLIIENTSNCISCTLCLDDQFNIRLPQ